MQLKYLTWLFAGILLMISAPACRTQVVPSGNGRAGQAYAVGFGPSSYNMDYGHGRMLGGTVWGDWYPGRVPQGLGLEVEARDLSLNRSSSQPKNLRQDTAGGGVIYSWEHYPRFHPYIKTLFEYGSFDFWSGSPRYTHDTRGLAAPGGGLEYHVYGPLWARVDYEYQIWQTLLGGNPDPQGFTVGVSYSFGTSTQPSR